MPAGKRRRKVSKKTKELSWSAPEFLVVDRGPLWYLFGGLSFVAAELLAVFVLRDIFTAVLVGISALVILFHHRLEPRTLDYKVGENSVHIGSNEYHSAQLKSFWFSYDPLTTLHLEIKNRALPISVPLDDVNEDDVREHLSKLIDEDTTKQEDFLSRVVRVLKL